MRVIPASCAARLLANRATAPATRSSPRKLPYGISPTSTRPNVLLPAPLGPSRPTISPEWSPKHTPSRARCGPKLTEILTASSNGGAAGGVAIDRGCGNSVPPERAPRPMLQADVLRLQPVGEL